MLNRGFLHIGLTCSAAMALAGCGSSNTPSSNNAEQVTPVDSAPAELEGAPDAAPAGTYINLKYNFSVKMPEGWAQNIEASNEDGSIYENKALDADVRASGAENEGDVDFQQAVEAVRDGTTDVEGAMIGDSEYRGAATLEGDRIRIRLVKNPKGALISVMVRYPLAQAKTLDPVAIQVLDSLVVNR